jgi:hypothetical protein
MPQSARPHQPTNRVSINPPDLTIPKQNRTKSFHSREQGRRFDAITSVAEVQEEGRKMLVRRHRLLLRLRHLHRWHRRRDALRRAAASAANTDAQISHPIGPIASEETND